LKKRKEKRLRQRQDRKSSDISESRKEMRDVQNNKRREMLHLEQNTRSGTMRRLREPGKKRMKDLLTPRDVLKHSLLRQENMMTSSCCCCKSKRSRDAGRRKLSEQQNVREWEIA